MELKLTGNRCKCTACGEYFNSVAAFEKHRTGAYPNRVCDTAKMEKNDSSYYITARNTMFER